MTHTLRALPLVLLGIALYVVFAFMPQTANAAFVYSRTPAGNGAYPAPVNLHIQGVFGVDFCTQNSADGYYIATQFNNSSVSGTGLYFHTPGETVNDTVPLTNPGVYNHVELRCTIGPVGNQTEASIILEDGFGLFTITDAPPPPPVPSDKEQCKNDGWQNYVDNNGEPFDNQGQCVSFVNHNS